MSPSIKPASYRLLMALLGTLVGLFISLLLRRD